jgi:hypothetical protein
MNYIIRYLVNYLGMQRKGELPSTTRAPQVGDGLEIRLEGQMVRVRIDSIDFSKESSGTTFARAVCSTHRIEPTA